MSKKFALLDFKVLITGLHFLKYLHISKPGKDIAFEEFRITFT